MNESPNQPEPISKTAKKAYNKPQIQIYGDLTEITRHVGTKGANDPPPFVPNTDSSSP